MSVRLLTTRLAKHGRYLLQSYIKREINTNILEQNYNKTRNRCSVPTNFIGSQGGIKPTSCSRNVFKTTSNSGANGIFRFGQHARKLFIDNILSRVTNTFSEDLRNQATRKLFYGDSAPFFALVGVSLATGAGMLTKEDEFEGVCWEIREAAGRLQSVWAKDDISENLDGNFNIDNLDIGPPIAKGCAAVVYAASIKVEAVDLSVDRIEHRVGNMSPGLTETLQPISTELITPIQNISRFVHNFGGSMDTLKLYNQSPVTAPFTETTKQIGENNENEDSDSIPALAVYSSGQDILEQLNVVNTDLNRFPLALKMMFNYDIQSNALSILRAMYRETVPARQRYMNEYAEVWERLVQDQTLTIPPHPNIVCMYGFFCDDVRDFPDGNKLYPIAQPQRINPSGYGRNMSLFLLMKRYDLSLRSLLDSHELKSRTKLLLFAQLLEAVSHINRHGIAHRDLKSDNILIEVNDDKSPPVLVLSDFGCCLADKEHPLQLPYTTFDLDKGGNAALMAPEIINKQPGPFAVLNYGKSDLWACGAIAYEIFGLQNPFYHSCGTRTQNTIALRNSDYKENDLPPLSDDCPFVVQKLIYNILHPNPSKRLSPDLAANVMQLFLWAPSNWMKNGSQPNSPEILQWLLSLSTKLMNEGRHTDNTFYDGNGRRTYVEYLLIGSFLARVQLRRIRKTLDWIHDVI